MSTALRESSVERYLSARRRVIDEERPTLDAVSIHLARTTGYSVEFLREFLTVEASG